MFRQRNEKKISTAWDKYRYSALSAVLLLCTAVLIILVPVKKVYAKMEIPLQPVLVSLTSAGSGQMTLQWELSEGAYGYRVYRLTEGEGYTLLKEIKDRYAVSYTDTTAEDGVIYQYTVTALNPGGESLASSNLYGTTSVQMPAIYDLRITEISPGGYRISAQIVSDIAVKEVKIPTWTNEGGQDDLIFHRAETDGSSFTCYISVSEHGNESGEYLSHIYLVGVNGKSYMTTPASVEIPDSGTHLTGPIVSDVTSDGYTVSCAVDTFSGISFVHVETKTEGDKNCVSESVTPGENYITYTVKTADHGNRSGKYKTTFFLYDNDGTCCKYTFEVEVPEDSEPVLTAVAVRCGHGDCTVLKSGGEIMLIDAGRSDEVQETIRVLNELGAKHVTVLITHSHDDHFGGLFELMKLYTVDKVYMNDFVSTAYEDECERRILLNMLAENNIPVVDIPAAGETITLGSAEIKVIGPLKKYGLHHEGATNDNSAWLMITCGSRRFLMCGDAEEIVEENMIASGVDLSADIVKVSHHGIDTSSSSEFAEAVSAEYALIEGGVPSIADEEEEIVEEGIAGSQAEIHIDMSSEAPAEAAEETAQETTEEAFSSEQ